MPYSVSARLDKTVQVRSLVDWALHFSSVSTIDTNKFVQVEIALLCHLCLY